MKRGPIILLSIFSLSTIYAQNIGYCGTDQLLRIWLNNNPKEKTEFLKRGQQAKTQDSISFLNGYANKTIAATVYTIPIVFHVLHLNGAENISDAQIFDEVNILNRDYRKQNADTINIVSPFQAADVRFEFRLATKDTNANCTTGIIRHADPNTNWTYPPSPSQYAYTWDPSKYLNIYVTKTITGFSTGGYSSFPGSNPSYADVIVVMNTCIGSIGTSNLSKCRILTHETGHFFNLEHIWGNNPIGVSCNDDGVADTPLTKGWNSCPASASLSAVCNPTITENYQNYMDYSFCYYMFSAGQVARMTAAINSTVSGRNNLWTNSNLLFTGVLSPLSPCSPIADCYATTNIYTVCVGQSLTFKDASYNGTITAWNWSVTGGGMISSPTVSTTNISFPTSGTQTVSLMVANSTGTAAINKIVTVINGVTNYTSTYQESFEAAGLPPFFNIINPDAAVTWAQTSLAASTGSNSYYINGSLDPAGEIDILETPSYDFLSNPGATFTFRYAYARYNTFNSDTFIVKVSSNCGATWTNISFGGNSTLCAGSGGTTTTPFIPTSTQFKLFTLTTHPLFNPFKTQPNVKLRFYFFEDANAGFGNNLYLDDINFNVPLGINELTKSIGFNLFPNPSEGSTTLEFTLSDNSNIKYFISDLLGRIVEKENSYFLESGSYTYKVNENQKLKSGIYFVNFELNGQRISQKLIVE